MFFGDNEAARFTMSPEQKNRPLFDEPDDPKTDVVRLNNFQRIIRINLTNSSRSTRSRPLKMRRRLTI